MLYCSIVWVCTSEFNLEPLFKLQKRSIRLITKSKYLAHTDPLFCGLKKLKIFEINKLQIVTFVYNCLYASSANEFYSQFCFPDSSTNYNTRYSSKLHILPYRTDIRKFSLKCFGPRLWNSLPSHVVSATSLYCFKKLFVDHYIQTYKTIT